MNRLAIFALAPAMLLVAACSESDPTPPPPPPPGDAVTVRMDEIAFIDPQGNRNEDAVVTIEVGETVEWVNEDSENHTVESTDGTGELNSGNIPVGESFSHTFNTAGTFVYLCGVHPTIMFDARVIVQESGSGGNGNGTGTGDGGNGDGDPYP